jgi:hypothetical protein
MRHHQHRFKENTMATAKKAPAKKTTPTPLQKKAKSTGVAPQKKFDMPLEVSNWIDQAMSTINHLRGEVERLKKENTDLKAYKRWAEHRILRSDHE